MIFKIESDERRPSRQIAGLLARHLQIPEDQRELFLKVARQEKASDHLDDALLSAQPVPLPARLQIELPMPLTSLVGREHELHAIAQQIQDPACRLLTLTGPGGVGKTRLALEVAHSLRERFHDGACFVSLVGTSAPEFIIPAIGDALQYSFSGTVEPSTQLFNFLKDRQLLLVLDNLEHLLDGVEVLGELLERVPNVKLLATSREPLELRAEWAFAVQGLPIPTSAERAMLEANSAAALFIQRARQVKMEFSPSAEDRAAIARICQQVEGLPLGLELAATWVNTLSCQEITVEIERSLDFLATSRRDIPERHRSLHAVFEYSWNLLTTAEQQALQALSVFHGGFQRDAAQQVAGAALPLLSSLMSKSFLRRSESGRYDQHELLRQYSATQRYGDQANEIAIRDRHATYYLALGEQNEHRLRSSQQWEALQQLSVEIDNFRAAWDWTVARGQFERLGPCLRSLLLIYDLRGWYAEGLERVGSIVRPLSTDPAKKRDRIETLALASAVEGWFHFRRGALNEARASFELALDVLTPGDDPVLLADVRSMFGSVLTSLGEPEKALWYVQEGLRAARLCGDRWRVGYALMMQGGILAGSQQPEAAYESSQEALTHFRLLDDTRLTVVTLNTLGFVAIQLARYREAREFLQESLTLITPAQDPWAAGTAYGNLGIVELSEGNAQEAQSLLQKSISFFRDLGMRGDVAVYQTYLGEAAFLLGAKKEAEQHWLDAIRIAGEARALPTLLNVLVRLAQLHAERGELQRAYNWARQVAEHPASWRDAKSRAEKLLRELESRFSPEQAEQTQPAAEPDFPDILLPDILGHPS